MTVARPGGVVPVARSGRLVLPPSTSTVPELSILVRQLRAADEQGVPLVQALATQAESLRERKRLRILEEGNRAAVRMIVPVGLFIFPVLIVILLYPAAVQLIGLGE